MNITICLEYFGVPQYSPHEYFASITKWYDISLATPSNRPQMGSFDQLRANLPYVNFRVRKCQFMALVGAAFL
jgi:hypothetical protein